MITNRAIEPPLYLNASDKFERWFSHNWRRLEAYFEQLGGDKYQTDEYLGFCRCQFDQQTLSPRDESILHEAQDQTARDMAEINESRLA